MKCSGAIYGGRMGMLDCYKNAKVERDGKWYCGIHDPVAVKAKREVRQAKWEVRYKAEQKRWKLREERDKLTTKLIKEMAINCHPDAMRIQEIEKELKLAQE